MSHLLRLNCCKRSLLSGYRRREKQQMMLSTCFLMPLGLTGISQARRSRESPGLSAFLHLCLLCMKRGGSLKSRSPLNVCLAPLSSGRIRARPAGRHKDATPVERKSKYPFAAAFCLCAAACVTVPPYDGKRRQSHLHAPGGCRSQ
jgi:hypothetical protein